VANTFLGDFAETTIRNAIAQTVNNLVGESMTYHTTDVQNKLRELFYRQIERQLNDPELQQQLRAKISEAIAGLHVEFPAPRRY
jgi:flagellar basal body-associated protein FliL